MQAWPATFDEPLEQHGMSPPQSPPPPEPKQSEHMQIQLFMMPGWLGDPLVWQTPPFGIPHKGPAITGVVPLVAMFGITVDAALPVVAELPGIVLLPVA